MGPTDCPETSVRNYHYSLRKNSEERSSHSLRGGSRKSRIIIINHCRYFIVVAHKSLYCGGVVTLFMVLCVETCRRVEGEMRRVPVS